jgi:hypothetical protein
MYRVIAIVGVGLALAACASDSNNPFRGEPAMETIRFESEPPGAEAKTSTGQTCRTPCALAMPSDKPFTVTFTLSGYQPATEQLQLTSMGDGTSKLRPNPVLVELTPAPPPAKPKKKVHRKSAAKPTPKPKPAAAKPAPAATSAPPPMTPAPQPQATSPWPAAPPPQSH